MNWPNLYSTVQTINQVCLAAGGHDDAHATDAAHDAAHHAAPIAEATNPITVAMLYASYIGMVIVACCIFASLYRILRGPTLADRVLASDALSMFVVAFVLLLGEILKTAVFFDAALMVAILGFVSTIAFSRFLFVTKAGNHVESQTGSSTKQPTDLPADQPDSPQSNGSSPATA